MQNKRVIIIIIIVIVRVTWMHWMERGSKTFILQITRYTREWRFIYIDETESIHAGLLFLFLSLPLTFNRECSRLHLVNTNFVSQITVFCGKSQKFGSEAPALTLSMCEVRDFKLLCSVLHIPSTWHAWVVCGRRIERESTQLYWHMRNTYESSNMLIAQFS